MAILTLAEYKSLMGVTGTDAPRDARVTALLDAASQAVSAFAGRDFEAAPGGAKPRQFLYDGSGLLEIDDCTAITSVSILLPGVDPVSVGPTEYRAMPTSGVVRYYLVLGGGASGYITSPEMGFERNLDRYEPLTATGTLVQVTAKWGWPSVPEAVKLAAALTISDLLADESGRSDDLTSESIEGFSRSWRTAPGKSRVVIPTRAQELLIPYSKEF